MHQKRLGTTGLHDICCEQLGVSFLATTKGLCPHPKFLENMVILCFERRFAKQNSVIRRKSNILAPQTLTPKKSFGLATTLRVAPEAALITGW